jgi:hypothetical protein
VLRVLVICSSTRLLRLAIRFCGCCDVDRQFDPGIDLMIRGLETGCP